MYFNDSITTKYSEIIWALYLAKINYAALKLRLEFDLRGGKRRGQSLKLMCMKL